MPFVDDSDPLNLLSFDGGGVRGYSSLLILDKLMDEIRVQAKWNRDPRPCEFFHMIAGTSTGGLIAIMLGRLGMSTKDAIKAYEKLAGEIFSFWNMRPRIRGGRYRGVAIEDAVREITLKYGGGDRMIGSNALSGGCKAFVCAVRERFPDKVERIRTYPSDYSTTDQISISQAARATTAAPLYFESLQTTGDDGKDDRWLDGAIGWNNPTEELLKEASDVFGKSRPIGCLISIGTGTKKASVEASASNPIAYAKSLLKTMKHSVTDTEPTDLRIREKVVDYPNLYWRFNVPLAAEAIGLAAHDQMPKLNSMTMEYVGNELCAGQIKVAAKALVEKDASHGATVGILCRPHRDQMIPLTTQALPQGTSSKYFTGRELILQQLSEHFAPRPAGGPRRTFLLLGLAGVGKSQIAMRFAEINKANFSKILWVDAAKPLTFRESYESLVPKIWDADHRSGKTAQDVRLWMEDESHTDNKEWLLVLDNLADYKTVKSWLPDGNHGNILCTSQDSALTFKYDDFLEVKVLDDTEASNLLLRVARLEHQGTEHAADCLKVVKALGNLPLMIDQAGVCIRRKHCTLREYKEMFEKEKARVLNSDDFPTTSDRDKAVFATFEITHKMIERLVVDEDEQKALGARHALQLLTLFGFLEQSAIYLDLVRKSAEARHPGKGANLSPSLGHGDHLDLGELLTTDEKGDFVGERLGLGTAILEVYSFAEKVFLESDPSVSIAVSMHVLVHDWARLRMRPEMMRRQCEDTWLIVCDGIPRDPSWESLVWRRRCAADIEACYKHVVALCPEVLRCTQAVEWHTTMAAMLEQAGLWYDAAEHWQKVCSLETIHHGGLGLPVASSLKKLAELYRIHSRLGFAEQTQLEGIERLNLLLLDLNEQEKVARDRADKLGKSLDPDRRRWADVRLTKDLAEIAEHQQAVQKSLLGHHEAMADIYWDQDNGPKLDFHIRRSQPDIETQAKDGYSWYIKCTDYRPFQNVEYKPINWPMLRAVIRYRVKTFGDEHPLTLDAQLRGSKLFFAQEYYEPAIESFAEQYEMYAIVFGAYSPKSCHVKLFWAAALARNEQYQQAREKLEDLLAVCDRHLRPDSRERLSCMLLLGAVRVSQLDFGEDTKHMIEQAFKGRMLLHDNNNKEYIHRHVEIASWLLRAFYDERYTEIHLFVKGVRWNRTDKPIEFLPPSEDETEEWRKNWEHIRLDDII